MFDYFSRVDWGWGGWMTLFGMGTVFALLALLFLLLGLIGRLDRPEQAAVEATPAAPELPATDEQDAAPRVTIADPSGLDDDTIAAIAVAVITHADVRRKQAAPETRATAPGSQLFASRWVGVGRGLQNTPFTRR